MSTFLLFTSLAVLWNLSRHATLTDRIYHAQMLGRTKATKLGRWLIYKEARREAARLLWPIRPKEEPGP